MTSFYLRKKTAPNHLATDNNSTENISQKQPLSKIPKERDKLIGRLGKQELTTATINATKLSKTTTKKD